MSIQGGGAFVLAASLLLSATEGVVGFVASASTTPGPALQTTATAHNNRRPKQSTTTTLSCICINCARVTNCQAYHFVEQQHSQPHINKDPSWEPRDGSPTIQVHIRPNDSSQNALRQMWSEHEEQTRQAEELAGSVGSSVDPLFGEAQYDLSGATSYEYDVIECADYVEETGAWVRNMPDEIKLANPDFVPT
mmetsp:Transcript_15979/g.36567  ORF Transcript_15979/g.36567 Transcript_15979/m.36567 type:complete len:193 (-) Transcript_15979:13-591(-)